MLFEVTSDFQSQMQSRIKFEEQLKQVRVNETLQKEIAEYTVQEMIYLMISCGYLTKRGGYISITTRHLRLLLRNILKDMLSSRLANLTTRSILRV
jgi:hypothetical protein